MRKLGLVFGGVFALVVGAGCTEDREVVRINLSSYPSGAKMMLSRRESAQTKEVAVWAPNTWVELQPGKHPFELGSYYYELQWPDGRKKFGLVALLESGNVLLK